MLRARSRARSGQSGGVAYLLRAVRGLFTTRDGFIFDSDKDELNTLSTGVTPVANVADPVGLMLDQHLGLTSTSKGAYLSGAVGTYVSSPTVSISSVAVLTITAKIAPTTWTPATAQIIKTKWINTGSQRSFALYLDTSGKLSYYQSADGVAVTDNNKLSTVVAPTTSPFVRVAKTVATGNIVFETSVDGVTYTQLGTTVAGSATMPFNSSAIMEVGSILAGTSNRFQGKIYEADVTVDGVLVSDFDAIDYVTGTTLTSPATGQVWTLNGATYIAPDGNHVLQATAAARPTYNKRKNRLLASATLSTQNVTTVAIPYTLQFTGAGTVTLSGTSTAGPLVGGGTLTFTPTAGTLTLTVTGSVTLAQLEYGTTATRYQAITTATSFDEVGFPAYINTDGVDDSLVAATGGAGFTGFYLCEVWRPLTAAGAVRTRFSDVGANTGYKVQMDAAGKASLSAGNGATYTATTSVAAVNPGDINWAEYYDDGVNLYVSLNGATPVSVARPVVSAGTVSYTLFKDNGAATSFATAQNYASVYVKNSGLTAGERANALAWAKAMAGV